ncbi:efflux RND transporter permease subunit [Saccharicrinis sp. FJH54]|uniref:efflux RND transporter permease subunit n=1 Tax=Saccharicrinis sp. FJH54 TaxID=3344665 RepID=UPI0035D50D1E
MHISELVFKKKKIFWFILVALIFGGIFSYQRLGKLEDPEITVMVASVVTVYPGASAHEVELKVTDVLEKELSELSDLNKLISRSEANVSIIQVELKMTVPQKEIPQRWDFLRHKLDMAMTKLPDGVQTPMVYDDKGDVYGMFYAMIADNGYSYQDMSNYASFIEKNMSDVKGVRKISIYGEQKPVMNITLTADKMSEMGILPIQIFAALGDHTSELYAGELLSGTEKLRVKVDRNASDREDLENILIKTATGESVRLGDIAAIEKGYSEPMRNTMFVNNRKAIGIGLSMESGDNILVVGKRVEDRMAELKKQIPAGITFQKVFFQPEKVNNAINGFMWNLVFSVIIVILVLMFTMGLRGGIIIGVGLILTILATFPFLLTANGTLQRISLGAFIVAMGMLVDNAIVVLDGILVGLKQGKKGKSAYTRPAKQTAIPLLGATLIAIAAFFPVYLSPDTAGTYVRDLFLVLAISLSISWVLALTQVPLFTAVFFKKRKKALRKEAAVSDPFNKPLYLGMKRFLEFAMHHRTGTIVVTFVLLALAIWNFSRVDNTFFPDFNYNQFYIEFTLPKGSTPDEVNEKLKEITDHFSAYDEVDMVVTSQGMTPMHYALVRAMMTENADNYGELIVNFKDYETMLRMRPVFSKYLRTHFPEAQSRIRKYNLSIKASHTIEAQFTGPDPAVLKRLSEEAKAIMLQNADVDKYTLNDDWSPKAKTVSALYNPVAANRVSVTRNDISNALLAATDGLPVAKVYEGETPLQVIFRVRDKDGNRFEDLNNIPVWSTIPNIGAGLNMNTIMGLYSGSSNVNDILKETLTAVPLSAVTNGVKMGYEEPVVRRLNGKRVIQAQCDPLEGHSPAEVQAELDPLIRKINLPEGYEFAWVGESELKTDAMKEILSYVPLAAGIIILILLLLFNDYRRPLIIILCLPMSVIGIVPGLLLTGQPFSFIAIVGVIGLSGMIIKNAIVLLDEIQVRLKTTTHAYQAVVDATISRVRPVIMASLTTILGMIPLLTDPMYASMAVAIIAGLIVGTMITLIFVPILYSVFFRVNIHNAFKES